MSKTFQDDNGSNSQMRVMSFLAFLAAIYFGHVTLKLPLESMLHGITIVGMFLSAAFGGKLWQKYFEVRAKNGEPK